MTEGDGDETEKCDVGWWVGSWEYAAQDVFVNAAFP